jgi:hypothetical protein
MSHCMDSAENSEQIMNILTKYRMWYFINYLNKQLRQERMIRLFIKL